MKTQRHPHIWLMFFFILACLNRAGAQNDLPTPTANIETIPAGAWIIPMDNTYQGGTTGIMNLKAYGLINQLLWNNIHLKWAIKSGKGKDSADFKVISTLMFPTPDNTNLIAGANFETSPLSPDWAYTKSGGGTNTTANKYNDGKSYRMTKNQSVTMTNTSLVDYTNVQLSVAFASNGNPSNNKDLYLDISYDNGATWNGTGSTTLVSGNSSASININQTSSNTVTPNPYIVNIPSTATQVNVRLRTSNSGSWTGSEFYYVDDIKLTGTYNRSFVSGPFIISPTDTAAARTVIDNYNSALAASAKVNVYKAINSFNADIRYTVSHKPKIAVYDDGGNATIHTDVLDAAGINSTYYTILNSGVIIDSVNCYTFASTPHWGITSYSSSDSARLLNLKSFLRSGGNFLAECEGIDAIENFAPSRYLTTAGVHTLNAAATTIEFRNNDMPVMQFHGGWVMQGGSIKNWNLSSGNWVYPRYTSLYFLSSGDTANIINVTKINASSAIGGNMVYLAGHSYAGSLLTDINGQRILLNAIMMPAKDLQASVTATSNSPVCPGDTIKLYGNVYPGFNFSWSGPNGFTSTLQNPTIPNATSAKAGTYTLTMTVPAGGGGCAYTYTTTAVVVNKPSLTVQSSQSIICEGDSVTLSFASSSGLSTANWYVNTGGTCGPNGTFIGTGLTKKVAPAATTKYTAIGFTSSGNCSDTAVNCITVTVDTKPVINSSTSTVTGACYGKGVSATITAGSGGTGCSETYQWRQDAGSWNSYTPGTTVGTTAHDSIEIKATRSCTSGCNVVIRSRWNVAAQIITTSSSTLNNCGDPSGYVAQLNATNPSPSTGLWTKTSGPGTVVNSTSYNTAYITGLSTTGATTAIKWVVTNSIGCKDSSSVSITPHSLDTTHVSLYSSSTCLTCAVKNGNTYYFYDLNGNILGTITDLNDGSALSNTSFCANLDYNPSNTPTAADVELEPRMGMPYLSRHWNVNADSTASYSMTVYLTDAEVQALIAASSNTQYPVNDISQLYITSYPSGSSPADPNAAGGVFIAPTYQRVGGGWTLTFPATGNRTFFVHPIVYPNATLPVELISLTANGMENYIRVAWATASEKNNNRFDVERSSNGKDFSFIGSVKGAGTVAEPRKYEFIDKNIEFNKMYYYRLKQVDNNGSVKTSNIVNAVIKKAETFHISELMPNPTQNYTSVQLSVSEPQLAKVMILGMDGKEISNNNYPIEAGLNNIELNVSQLEAGTYLCRFETSEGIAIKKLIVSK